MTSVVVATGVQVLETQDVITLVIVDNESEGRTERGGIVVEEVVMPDRVDVESVAGVEVVETGSVTI